MSTPVLERPPMTLVLPEAEHACEERRNVAPVMPETWASRLILKSYLSSFNLCMSDLGWTPKSILEVGCGDGSMLSYVGQTIMNARVMGVEFDQNTVAFAKERNCCRIEFVSLNPAETLPFESNAFDVVISHGFLGNTPLPRHWVREMARVSAEGLIVSAQTPVGSAWLHKLPGADKAKLIGRPVFSPQTQPISLRLLKTWVEREGLKVESMLMPAPYGMLLARKPQTAP